MTFDERLNTRLAEAEERLASDRAGSWGEQYLRGYRDALHDLMAEQAHSVLNLIVEE